MLGFDQRAARYTWTAAAVVLALVLIYLLRTTLFIFVLALLFAYLLSPLVNLLDRALPGRTRAPALTLAYIIFVGAMVLLATQIGARVADQASTFTRSFPAMLQKWQAPSPGAPPEVNNLKADIVGRIQSAVGQSTSGLLEKLPAAGVKFLTVAGDLLYVVIIPILAFFFLKDGRELRDQILDLVDDGPKRVLIDDLMADINLLLAHYMRALLLLALAAFTAYSIFFEIVGVPYALLLAALGGMLEFIPMLGPLTAGVLMVIIGAVAGAPVVVMIIFLLCYRVFQDYILSPHLMGQGVALHPLLVLFGIFAGAEIAGIAGTFLSVPILALVRIIYVRIRKARLSLRVSPAGGSEIVPKIA
jgi:predicted PurR-regulated permease PerM